MTLTNKISLSTNAILIIAFIGFAYLKSCQTKNLKSDISDLRQEKILNAQSIDSLTLDNGDKTYRIKQAELSYSALYESFDSLKFENKQLGIKNRQLKSKFETIVSGSGSGSLIYMGDSGYYSDKLISIWLWRANLKYQIKPQQISGYVYEKKGQNYLALTTEKLTLSEITSVSVKEKQYNYLLVGGSSSPGLGARLFTKKGWQFGYEYQPTQKIQHNVSVYYSLFRF